MHRLPGVDTEQVEPRTGRWAEHRAELRAIKDGHAQGRASSLLAAFFSSSFSFSFSFALALPLSPSSLAHGEAEVLPRSLVLRSRLGGRPVHGGTDGRRGSAVVWWTCAFGRGVPERVRGPREESGPGATTPTVVGERTRRTHREVATPLFSLGFLCK